MRRLALAAFAATTALAVPTHAAPPDLSKIVTVERNGPVDCVRFPCPQPPPVTVCVIPANLCTPR